MLAYLHLVRAFEERALELSSHGLVHGPVHSSIGQEGGAVGSITALRADDHVNGSHRGHHQFLAKGLTTSTRAGSIHARPSRLPSSTSSGGRSPRSWGSPRASAAGAVARCTSAGTRRGRSGRTAIVGGGVPLAAAMAFAHQRAGKGDLAVTYFGDGAVNIGSVLES